MADQSERGCIVLIRLARIIRGGNLHRNECCRREAQHQQNHRDDSHNQQSSHNCEVVIFQK